jgi:hypothetical protein
LALVLYSCMPLCRNVSPGTEVTTSHKLAITIL